MHSRNLVLGNGSWPTRTSTAPHNGCSVIGYDGLFRDLWLFDWARRIEDARLESLMPRAVVFRAFHKEPVAELARELGGLGLPWARGFFPRQSVKIWRVKAPMF